MDSAIYVMDTTRNLKYYLAKKNDETSGDDYYQVAKYDMSTGVATNNFITNGEDEQCVSSPQNEPLFAETVAGVNKLPTSECVYQEDGWLADESAVSPVEQAAYADALAMLGLMQQQGMPTRELQEHINRLRLMIHGQYQPNK